jgi:glycosyltransferase involved in cell wall biosynthesis
VSTPTPAVGGRVDGQRDFPEALHVCGYDVRGTYLDTGELRRTRETGLVAHTHQLFRGLAQRHPDTRIAVTVTGSVVPDPVRRLRTPEDHVVDLRTIASSFPGCLREPGHPGKSASLVRHFYEDTIDDPNNPIWRSLAEQYARAIGDVGIPDLLVQNTNPLVGVLKAEEFGLLDVERLGGPRVTGVIHDAADVARRFGYLARRIEHTRARVTLIAVSDSVRRALVDHGVAPDVVRTVRNGLDVRGFQERLERARTAGTFDRVRERNGLPPGRVVLVSARRVRWKGHRDVIAAAGLLEECGAASDVRFVFNGAGMLDTRWPGYEADLVHQIHDLGLSHRVFLLDALTPDEVASCYVGADVAVGASREPEPFGYSNIEAMLAGVPVVATRHGGPLEYIEDGVSGLLVSPADPSAIAGGIQALLSDDELYARVVDAGRTSARRFTLDAMVDGYEAALATYAPPSHSEGLGV